MSSPTPKHSPSSSFFLLSLLLVLSGRPSSAALEFEGQRADENECTKEEYVAKFGAQPTYELLADPPAKHPGIEGNSLVADVSYVSSCMNGGSAFSGNFIEKQMGDKVLSILILSRSQPQCEETQQLEEPTQWRGTISVKLAEEDRVPFMQQPFSFIAFPPDGEYELMQIKARESDDAKGTPDKSGSPSLRAQN